MLFMNPDCTPISSSFHNRPSFFVVVKDFIYLFVRKSEHRQTERQAEAEGEAGSLLSKEPDVGLDTRTRANARHSLWDAYSYIPSIFCNCRVIFILFYFFLRFYLFICQREWAQADREAGRGRGRSKLPAEQGARCGTRSQDPGIMTWAEGSRLTNWATQASRFSAFYHFLGGCEPITSSSPRLIESTSP